MVVCEHHWCSGLFIDFALLLIRKLYFYCMRKGFLLVLLLAFASPKVFAQGCSVCTKVANGLNDKKAKGMNNGILYLAAFPLTIMLTIGFLYWKSQKNETHNE